MMVDNSGTKISQLCVVALIGKSTLFEQQCNKSWKLNQLIQTPAFKEHVITNTEDDFEHYYDHINNTIYVHLRSFHDTYQLLNLIDNIHDDTSIQNFAQLWENKQANFIKKCLICFLLSHIIVISHSSHTFDLNYLRFFRIIELLRHKSKPAVLDAIRSLNLLKDADIFLNDGRLCVPRALFIFENHHKGNDAPSNNDRDDDPKSVNMARNLENIIFNALRCSYIISNQTNSALFTIAHKQPFVFIHRCYKEAASLGQTQKLLGILQDFVKQTKESSSNSNLLNRTNSQQQDDSFAFKRFLFRHVEEALTDGWSNDGISGGARSESSSFELCTYTTWTRLFNSLRELFESSNKALRQAFNMLRANVDPDGKLSETRCKKCLPMAIKYYEDGLPSRYTRHFHEQRLQAATEFFATYARGSSYKRYVQQLIDQCTRLWQDGRQLCEAISLTRNPCKNELHRVLGEEDLPESANLAHLPVRAHSSKVQFMAASNCGQILQEREDPFSLKEANYEFYQDVNKMLSVKPIYFEFPIFRGTTTATEPIRAGNKQKTETKHTNLSNDLSGASELSQSKSVALFSPAPNEEQQALDNITGEKTDATQLVTCTDDVQPIPSTTEYLDGMTHSDSPPGLLPKFSSWSLCCIGRASDYVSTKGLQQPGFLTNLNYLIPWDINPHNNQASTNNPAGGGAAQYHQQRPAATRSYKHNRRGGQSSSIWDVTIRVYIGCEYECPRGHRFLCSSPNHVIRVGPNGVPKDDGAKLVRSDMPLYTPCSCRIMSTGARVWAQLMRAYVVTPTTSTPIQCVLHPQVIPAGPNSPTFFPSYTQPIHLTEDSIWVLRFPFIYHDGERALSRPQNEEDISQCLVLRDLFSWTNKS